ncbi:MAG: hypothetical protein KGZ79_01035 [Dethiobacter sp.]|jgi:uncharacterized ferredoxin-like protein|nr:hypothetical protein [Dethiobacter sp.]
MEIMETVAQLMALSARTAPKAGGKDFVEIKVIKGEELNRLADDMVSYGEESGKGNFDRDGKNVRNSDAVLLLALKDAGKVGLNCGACGFSKCADLTEAVKGPEFDGPWCAWRLMDLGIALGSAVKTASILNADNRIMYRIGVSARRLEMIEGQIVVGVPISVSGKSIYFDR